MYATQLAGVPSYRRTSARPWTVSRVLWIAMSRSRMLAGIEALRAAGTPETWKGFDPDGPMPMISDRRRHRRRDRRITVGAQKIAPCGRTPPRSRLTAHSLQVPTCSATPVGHASTTDLHGGVPLPPGRWLVRRPVRRAELARDERELAGGVPGERTGTRPWRSGLTGCAASCDGTFRSGVTIVTALHRGIQHAMTATAVCGVSLDPPLVLVCVSKSSRFYRAITDADNWCLSLLTVDQEQIAWHFSNRGRDLLSQFDDIPHTQSPRRDAADR